MSYPSRASAVRFAQWLWLCGVAIACGADGENASKTDPNCASGCTDASSVGDGGGASTGGAGTGGAAGSSAAGGAAGSSAAGGASGSGGGATTKGAVGDPCTSSDDCASPAYCGVDGYCQRTCSTDADCAGSGPGGTNRFGLTNPCVRLSSGASYCWLGCSSDAQCDTVDGFLPLCCGTLPSSVQSSPWCQSEPCLLGPGGTGGAGGGSGGAAGTGGSGTGGSTGPNAVTCASTGPHLASEPWCSCGSNGGTGAPTYSGQSCVECDYASLPFMCCAREGYPFGGACDCYVTGSWNCKASSSSCTCNFTPPSNTPTSVCDAAPGSDGIPWRCCKYPSSSQCYCSKDGPPCQAGGTEVSDCATLAPLGIQSPPSACPIGSTEVTSCSNGLGGSQCPGNCSNDDQCPGDCTGSDPLCCPSCVDGHCGQCCSGSSGFACF